jgi:ribosomal-protein-alanine N-acetyltransferase
MTSIDPMTPDDLDAVVAIEAVSFPIPWTMDMFVAEMRHDFSRCRVLREGGRIVGYIVFWLTVDEVQLHQVAIAPGERGRGLGRILMEGMLDEGRRHGAGSAILEVRVGNAPAIALYERLGFTRAGLRRAYYRDNDEDALVMVCALTRGAVA